MAEANNQQEPQQGQSFVWGLLRMMLVYFLVSSVVKVFTGQKTQSEPANTNSFQNLLNEGDFWELDVFLVSENKTSKLPVWSLESKSYDYSPLNSESKSINITLTPYMQNNGTVFLETKFKTFSTKLNKTFAFTSSRELTTYDSILMEETVNLIAGEPTPQTKNSKEKAMHWKPSVDIYVVVDSNVYPSFPPQLISSIQTYENYYMPIVDPSDFWVLKEHMIPLNESISEVPLTISVSTAWVYKYLMIKQFQESQTMGDVYGVSSKHEYDLMKRMFLETNPYFLGLTMVVSMVHMLFEFLAFKSEIEFWKGREDLRGLSTNMLVYNFIASIVVFLYLMDTEETSWAIWLPMGIGIAIDFWKLNKGFDISLKPVFPFISVKGKESHKAGGTESLDNKATKFLFFMLMPCIACYSIYSLFYDEYRSWYSWVIGSLARFIYTAGFIMMTPQLYINYKLQSVAHMPWKVLTYRALNTFIDDMFAFIIAMPTMHRLACFRDDIIFVVYLYQRWKYRVDPNRHYLEQDAEPKEKTN